MIKYAGFRWVRGGIEGLTDRGPTTLQTYLDLHRQTGVRFSWGLVSGGTDLKKLIATARPLAEADALLAFEGNNEPNNWGVTYQGETGGGRAPSWLAVAKLQRDLYKAVKGDPVLKKYPVWSISENGAEADNVGLQFLTIPEGAGTLLPAGTRFADSANVHNYIYHPGSPGLGGQQDLERRRPDLGVQGRRPLRQLRRHLGEALPRLFGGRPAHPAAGDHRDRLHDRRPGHRGDPGAEPAEHVPGPVQAGLESYGRLPPARPHRRGRQPELRVLQGRLHAAQGRRRTSTTSRRSWPTGARPPGRAG